jgi:hypothetical protein
VTTRTLAGKTILVSGFGGIDAVVNNASGIDLSPTTKITMERYDLDFLLPDAPLPVRA